MGVLPDKRSLQPRTRRIFVFFGGGGGSTNNFRKKKIIFFPFCVYVNRLGPRAPTMSARTPSVGEMRNIVASAGIALTDSKHAVVYDMVSDLVEMAVRDKETLTEAQVREIVLEVAGFERDETELA